jgi:hypothetical protein
MSTLPGVLTLYSWILLGALTGILILIARFYQTKYAELYKDTPQHRTYYALLVIPLLLFIFAAGRYAWRGDLCGDIPGDLALSAGGIVLFASSYHLYRLMTGRRH